MLLAGEAGPSAPKLAMNCTQALKPLCEQANALAGVVWQALVDQEARAQLEAFAAHLERYGDRYAELKAERGALDYEDLLLAARRVLEAGSPYDLARVYVDEFQDANSLQAGIVDRSPASGRSSSATAPRPSTASGTPTRRTSSPAQGTRPRSPCATTTAARDRCWRH